MKKLIEKIKKLINLSEENDRLIEEVLNTVETFNANLFTISRDISKMEEQMEEYHAKFNQYIEKIDLFLEDTIITQVDSEVAPPFMNYKGTKVSNMYNESPQSSKSPTVRPLSDIDPYLLESAKINLVDNDNKSDNL